MEVAVIVAVVVAVVVNNEQTFISYFSYFIFHISQLCSGVPLVIQK
jgi:hypothetical protein